MIAYIYQRSADVEKMFDDLVYYAQVIRRFEEATGSLITDLVIAYGNMHCEITDNKNENKSDEHMESPFMGRWLPGEPGDGKIS